MSDIQQSEPDPKGQYTLTSRSIAESASSRALTANRRRRRPTHHQHLISKPDKFYIIICAAPPGDPEFLQDPAFHHAAADPEDPFAASRCKTLQRFAARNFKNANPATAQRR